MNHFYNDVVRTTLNWEIHIRQYFLIENKIVNSTQVVLSSPSLIVGAQLVEIFSYYILTAHVTNEFCLYAGDLGLDEVLTSV